MSDTGELLFTPELISDAVAELTTVHDWLRFAVSKLNQADVYLGHGTDNPWDEAASHSGSPSNTEPVAPNQRRPQ